MKISTLQDRGRRIEFLDGLRGLAILLVMGFHAFARYPELMPYGNEYAWFPPFQYGFLGVQLFFLISGFVIFMTLEKTVGYVDFMLRRWLRLFPAMLICSIIVYFTFTFLMPGVREVSLRSLLPGLTFMEPKVWAKVLGSPQPILEGAFWSLYVEVRFYAFAGFLFLLFGETAAIAGIIGMFLLASALGPLQALFPGASFHILEIYRGWTSSEHFGWFAAGALYYRFFRTKSRLFLLAALVVALPAALTTNKGVLAINFVTFCMAMLVVVFFALAVHGKWLRPILCSRFLLFFGYISYPLYLVHENIMVQLTLKVAQADPEIHGIALSFIPIAVVVGIGYLVAAYGEPSLTRIIRPHYSRFRKWMKIEAPTDQSLSSVPTPPTGGAVG